MIKVGNFTKESIRNGAKVLGGHRIKFVSEDKEFVILQTASGNYQGFYLDYEKDGAYVDQERTPAPNWDLSFETLDDCKKHFKIGEDESPIVDRYHRLKAKHQSSVILLRCGDFYETFEEDAKVVSETLGITLTKRGSTKMTGFPYHAIDSYLPKLVRAGLRVAICDKLEKEKLLCKKKEVEEMVKQKEQPKEKVKVKKVNEEKVEQADATVQMLTINTPVSSQIDMRKIVTEACKAYDISTDHVAVWQHNGNGDFGLAVAFIGKKPVALAPWERERTEKKTTYKFCQMAEKFNSLRSRI